jgi:hypothetical protein
MQNRAMTLYKIPDQYHKLSRASKQGKCKKLTESRKTKKTWWIFWLGFWKRKQTLGESKENMNEVWMLQ